MDDVCAFVCEREIRFNWLLFLVEFMIVGRKSLYT